MLTADLQTVLSKLGVVRSGGSNVARCCLCQPEEIDPDAFKLYVSAGSCVPVVVFCQRCGRSKPTTEEDRQHNRTVARANFLSAGVDLDVIYQRLPADDIQRMWSEVRIGGFPPAAEADRASDDTLNAVYSDLLSRLELTHRHRRWLKKRGLEPDWCFDRGYRTADQSLAGVEDRRLGVPGLTTDGRWLLREDALLVPSRDNEGRIGCIKQRLFDSKRGRMRLLSGGGTKAKVVIHHPVGSVSLDGPLFIVEGERAADVLYYHFRQPVVGLPGAGCWSRVIDAAIRSGVVVLALDADSAGRRCLSQLGHHLRSAGVEVQLAVWPEGFKGIDDALAGGGTVRLEEWKEKVAEGGLTIPNPQPKGSISRFSRGQKLSDHQVVPYLLEMGPTLRQNLNAYPPTVSELIRSGRLKMTKRSDGQWLEVSSDKTD